MKVDIGDMLLFLDVEGAKLVPDGPRMREKPTLLLMHGGPGFDYSHYKPAFSALSDVAQLVYVDHRGQGRSDRNSPAHWHLTQWADDILSLALSRAAGSVLALQSLHAILFVSEPVV